MTKIKIEYIREEIDKYLKNIREEEVLPFFQTLAFNSTLTDYSRNIRTFKITDIKSLDKVPSQPGFYIIFSDINHENNDCTAIFSDLPEKTIKAIYRGEGYNVRLRLKSHLFNDLYAEDFKKSGLELNKDSNFYRNTLSINGAKVNISLKPFKEFEWYVVYIAAPKSNQNVRDMYEDSFDQVFGKPKYSKDK
ncbi:hypothetical protein [Lysinibacillus irui]|uniref:Uncharacterized protein n=1 Tax=Lysinibacillus irui TaxID=2998077 RepID=A0AAJ5UW87_9BACI|nr:hypothetical protein [Lysinibacillus irui]WDV09208.1 hypothetical protein OU989_23255 [Lysinibacillus irui]